MRGRVFLEAFYADAADSAGCRVNIVFILRIACEEGDLVQPQAAIGIALHLRGRYSLRSNPCIRQRGGQGIRLGKDAAALIARHFQRLFGIQLPGILHNRAILGADPVFILKAAEAEFDIIHGSAVMHFSFNGEPAHIRRRSACDLERLLLRGCGGNRSLRACAARQRQKRRSNRRVEFLFHGVASSS